MQNKTYTAAVEAATAPCHHIFAFAQKGAHYITSKNLNTLQTAIVTWE